MTAWFLRSTRGRNNTERPPASGTNDWVLMANVPPFIRTGLVTLSANQSSYSQFPVDDLTPVVNYVAPGSKPNLTSMHNCCSPVAPDHRDGLSRLSYSTHIAVRAERRQQQSHRMQILNPLALVPIRKVAILPKGPLRFSKRRFAPSFPATCSINAKRYPSKRSSSAA